MSPCLCHTYLLIHTWLQEISNISLWLFCGQRKHSPQMIWKVLLRSGWCSASVLPGFCCPEASDLRRLCCRHWPGFCPAFGASLLSTAPSARQLFWNDSLTPFSAVQQLKSPPPSSALPSDFLLLYVSLLASLSSSSAVLVSSCTCACLSPLLPGAQTFFEAAPWCLTILCVSDHKPPKLPLLVEADSLWAVRQSLD